MNSINFTIRKSDEILYEKPTLNVVNKSAKNSRNSEKSEEKYGAGVLVGNWFNRRSKYTHSFNEWQSTYKSVYKVYNSEFLQNDKTVAWDRKIEDEGLGAKFIIGHYDEEYLKNMSSTNDIFHRIIPQKVPGLRTFKIKRNEWLPQQDLLQSFGNATEYGFVKYKQYKIMMDLEDKFRPWDTTYQFFFVKPQGSSIIIEKRFLKPHSDFNQVNLDHLGIDLKDRYSCPIAHQLQAKLPREP